MRERRKNKEMIKKKISTTGKEKLWTEKNEGKIEI